MRIGYKHTKETLMKMSKALMGNKSNTGRKLTKQHRLNISLGNTGRVFSLESKRKISDSKKGKNHHFFGKKLSKEHIDNIKRSLSEEKSYKWRGDKVGYRALHYWVEDRLGKPHYCEHCKRSDLPHRSYQWANVSRKYKREISDWIRLCIKCHRKYDKKI